jgi:Ca-activated chloride channel family protein
MKTLRVSLYLDDVLVSGWQGCPCVADVAVSDLENAAILSAEVVDLDGNRSLAVLNTNGAFSGAVRVELVELQVQVFESHDVPVTGLAVDDFSVFEDGAEVEIAGFGTAEDEPLSLLLAADSSGSMTDIFPEVRRAVEDFAADLLQPGDRASLIRFATEIEMVVPWSGDPRDIARGIDQVLPGGSTKFHDAIIQSQMELHSFRGRKAVVVLTDGNDTSSFATSADAMWFSQLMRVPLFVITLARGSVAMIARSSDIPQVRHRHQVATLAQRSGGRAFFRVNLKQLPKIYSEIAEILRSQYVIWYQPPPESADGEFHTVEVSVADPDLEVRTISGYYSIR